MALNCLYFFFPLLREICKTPVWESAALSWGPLRGRRCRESTLLPGAASENSGNDFREVKGGGVRVRVRRAAKPQSGRIRHHDDCLVGTSNFSSLSAWVPTPPPSHSLPALRSPDRRLWKQKHTVPLSQSQLEEHWRERPET